MKYLLIIVFSALLPSLAITKDAIVPVAVDVIRPAGDSDLTEFKWLKRPVIVFADTPADPRFAEQMNWFEQQINDLTKRDVIILTDTDSTFLSPVREKLRPRGFMLVLVGKDGIVYLRKPFPWSVRDLTRSIDKMPLRQQEIRDRRGEG